MRDIKTFVITDKGLVRKENEDSYLVKEYKDIMLLVVADGMGGLSRGKEASTLAVKTIEEYFNKNKNSTPIEDLISNSLWKANEEIWLKAMNKNNSMGTTCTLLVLKEEDSRISGYISHVGDSKLFHIRDDLIVQRTEDHTWVSQMVRSGLMTKKEAENSPNKNLLTKSLGGKKKIDLEPPSKFEILKGDILMLCTDGLTAHVNTDEILSVIKSTKNLKTAGEYLVKLANSRGGTDNITIILIEYGEYERDLNLNPPPLKADRKSKSLRKILIASLSLILVFLLFLLIRITTLPVRKYMSSVTHLVNKHLVVKGNVKRSRFLNKNKSNDRKKIQKTNKTRKNKK